MTIQELAHIYRTDRRYSYSSNRLYLRPFGQIAYTGLVANLGGKPSNIRFRTAVWSYSWHAPQGGDASTELTYRWRRNPKG